MSLCRLSCVKPRTYPYALLVSKLSRIQLSEFKPCSARLSSDAAGCKDLPVHSCTSEVLSVFSTVSSVGVLLWGYTRPPLPA